MRKSTLLFEGVLEEALVLVAPVPAAAKQTRFQGEEKGRGGASSFVLTLCADRTTLETASHDRSAL